MKNICAEGMVSTKAVRSNRVRSREEASVAETHAGKGDGSYIKSGTGKGKAWRVSRERRKIALK